MAEGNPIETVKSWLIIIGIFILSSIIGFLGFSFFTTLLLIITSIVIIGSLFGILKARKQKKEKNINNAENIVYDLMEGDAKYENINDYPNDIPFFLAQALEAETNEDFLSARVSYMQAVEILKSRCPKKDYNKYIDSLQKMYDGFVLRDPYYKKLMQPLLTIIKDNSGILQSQITKQFEESDWGALKLYNRPVLKDDIYYALYFADRFGDIVRIKKGRSYLLYLPNLQPIADKIATEDSNSMNKKINVDFFSFSYFMELFHECEQVTTQSYNNEDYILYIKNTAKMAYYHFCFIAFRPTIGNEIDNIEDVFFIELFPMSGRSHKFQAFKKLNIQESIPLLNKAFIEFTNTKKEDILKINSIVTEHHQRWKKMKPWDKVELLDQLALLYKADNKSNIYERYFIYENAFLRKKFNEYKSGSDFENWWNTVADNIITNK